MRRRPLDFASAAVAVAILTAVPFLLALTVGWPLPTSLGFQRIWCSQGALDLATTTAWFAWTACCIPLCRRVAERVRNRDTASDNDGRVVDWLATRIAATILAFVPASIASATAVGAVSSQQQIRASQGLDSHHSTGSHRNGRTQNSAVQLTSKTADSATKAEVTSATSYITARSDWVWLGRGSRTRMHSRNRSGEGVPSPPHIHSLSFGFWVSNGHTATRAARPRVRYFNVPTGTRPGVALVDLPVLLSDLATAGLCCLGASALGRRVRPKHTGRRRNPQPLSHADAGGRAPTPVGYSYLDVPIAFEDLPAYLCELLSKLESAGRRWDVPAIRLIRSGPDGLEFILSGEIDWSPEGWLLGADGRSWVMGPNLGFVPPTIEFPPRFPALLPVGRDARGNWAVVLDPQSSMVVFGSKARVLVSSFELFASNQPWSENAHVRSTTDGLEFVWSVDSQEESPPQYATVTTRHTHDVDLTIIVDSRALTIHPQGLSLQPYDSTNDSLISEQLTVQQSEPPIRPLRFSAPLSTNSPIASSAGDLEVKLLTALPSIEGLHDALPPKRVRRATEVIAYLALHQPDPISSDRLRTRVLGSPDSDAAAKTLFNTVGAARRALGSDLTGQLYLPNASRYGHYKLSELVTVDVTRTTRLVVAAKSANSVDESIALYRAAFDLVKGEPLAGVLSGYSWWRSEGHEARLTTTIVDAACRAVQLAISEGLLDLASWILDRSRLVDPYSELLSRAAMATAAASGDRSRLRREWDECRRRVSELDPGGVPSHETENLFHHLSRGAPMTSSRHQASFAAIEDAP